MRVVDDWQPGTELALVKVLPFPNPHNKAFRFPTRRVELVRMKGDELRVVPLDNHGKRVVEEEGWVWTIARKDVAGPWHFGRLSPWCRICRGVGRVAREVEAPTVSESWLIEKTMQPYCRNKGECSGPYWQKSESHSVPIASGPRSSTREWIKVCDVCGRVKRTRSAVRVRQSVKPGRMLSLSPAEPTP